MHCYLIMFLMQNVNILLLAFYHHSCMIPHPVPLMDDLYTKSNFQTFNTFILRIERIWITSKDLNKCSKLSDCIINSLIIKTYRMYQHVQCIACLCVNNAKISKGNNGICSDSQSNADTIYVHISEVTVYHTEWLDTYKYLSVMI